MRISSFQKQAKKNCMQNASRQKEMRKYPNAFHNEAIQSDQILLIGQMMP